MEVIEAKAFGTFIRTNSLLKVSDYTPTLNWPSTELPLDRTGLSLQLANFQGALRFEISIKQTP
jgi:hypothetical protein